VILFLHDNPTITTTHKHTRVNARLFCYHVFQRCRAISNIVLNVAYLSQSISDISKKNKNKMSVSLSNDMLALPGGICTARYVCGCSL